MSKQIESLTLVGADTTSIWPDPNEGLRVNLTIHPAHREEFLKTCHKWIDAGATNSMLVQKLVLKALYKPGDKRQAITTVMHRRTK